MLPNQTPASYSVTTEKLILSLHADTEYPTQIVKRTAKLENWQCLTSTCTIQLQSSR